MTEFSYDENFLIVISIYVVAGLGALGSLFTLVTFIICKEARNVGTSLIFCLALSDLFLSIPHCFFWTFTSKSNWYICNLQGTILMFGLCTSLVWSLIIGIYLFLALYKNMEIDQIDRFRYVFHIIAWGYGIVGAFLPVYFNQYDSMMPANMGDKLTWCWINGNSSYYRLILYVPDTIIFVLLFILYGLIQHEMKRNPSYIGRLVFKKMSIYLLAYAFINTFAIVNRVLNYIVGENPIYVLLLLQYITQLGAGFYNAIAYSFTEPAFVDKYKTLFKKCMPRKKETAQEKEERRRLQASLIYDPDESYKHIDDPDYSLN